MTPTERIRILPLSHLSLSFFLLISVHSPCVRTVFWFRNHWDLCWYDLFNKVDEFQSDDRKQKENIAFVFSSVWTCLICSSSTRLGTLDCHLNTLNEEKTISFSPSLSSLRFRCWLNRLALTWCKRMSAHFLAVIGRSKKKSRVSLIELS